MQKTALAQYINIGKYQYPSIIIVPVASIIISLIILLILVFRVLKKKERVIVNDFVSKIKAKAKKIKKSRVNERGDKEKEINYLTEIKRFRKHLSEFDSEKAFDILSGITKKFFKELLNLNYEFTYNELSKELRNKNKKKELIEICERFSDLKYGGSKISKEELGKFADELEGLLKKEKRQKEEEALGTSKAFQQKKGFFNNFIFPLKALREEKISEKEKKRKLIEMMQNEEEALKKDMDIAKNIYHKMLESYYRLPPKEKKEVYEQLTKFYNGINEMLFSSIYSEKSKKQLEYFANKLAQIKEEQEKDLGKKEVHEKMPAKPEKHHEISGVTKSELKPDISELKELGRIEEQAKERIKMFGESIVKHAISKELTKQKYPALPLMPAIKIEPVFSKPEAKPNLATEMEEIPKAIVTHAIVPKKIIEPEKEKAEKVKEEYIAKHKVQVSKPVKKGKPRKLARIEREAEEIKARLERLHQQHYIG